MDKNLIAFKGNNKGINIYIKDGSFESIKEELNNKIKKSKDFFKGAKVIDICGVEGKKLTSNEKEQLETILKEDYNMIIEQKKEKKEKEDVEVNTTSKEGILDNIPFQGIKEGFTKFIKATIRSGQVVESEGNVVILGDVNPGGVIVAKGNIIVLGSLKGVAKAGCDGNRDALVAAFSLQPTQLRIADTISRRPDGDVQAPKWPEIAIIHGESIVIEPYTKMINR